MSTWSGRKVRRLTNLVLTAKGRTCHLCGLPGADSADHDPPRSVLIANGAPNPDLLRFLWPSHLVCNVVRKARPVTEQLRDECRAKYLASIGQAPSAGLSSVFAERRRSFEAAPTSRKVTLPPSPPGLPEKTERS